MTLNQLMQDVAALGFEGGIEDDDIFISSANRALGIIYSDRPVTDEVTISYDAPGVLSYVPCYRHTGKDPATFKLPGKAYSFKCSGNGYFTVSEGYRRETREFHGNMLERHGTFADGGEITFFGDYAFAIYHLSSFDSQASLNTSDIKIYDGRERLSARDYIPDFLSFKSLPTDARGQAISGAYVREEYLYLPDNFRGEIRINYRCAPPTLSLLSPDSEIKLPRELEPLLPLLTASFMWLDDDSDRAEYYMSLYREGIAGVLRYHTREITTDYITNGWA